MNEEYYVLITGASQGIGKAFAYEMAGRRQNLIINALPGEGLQSLRDEIIRTFKVKVFCFENDLTDKDGPKQLYDFIKHQSLKVNFLINNAGIGLDGRIENHTPACIDTMLFLNIRAATLLVSFLTRELKQAPESYILNVSSFGSYLPVPFKSVYLSSKSYIYFFTRSLQEEFKETRVKACVVLPGPVKTNKKVIERINASGFIGKTTALTPEEFVKSTIRKVLKGKEIIIEGRLNSIIFSIATITPEGILLNLLKRVFSNRADHK